MKLIKFIAVPLIQTTIVCLIYGFFSSFFISFSTELSNVLHYKSSYSSSVSVLQAFDPVRYKAFGFAMA